MIDFFGHLKRQLGFLERSCASYDAGFHDEAIRIATMIRVLVHNTNASTSLLKHLNAMDVNLLSTVEEPSPQTIMYVGLGMMVAGKYKGEYVPLLGGGPPTNQCLPSDKWWNQTVLVLSGKRISRKDIVLAAANKDGGAHVDVKLSAEYEALAKDGAVGAFVYQTEGEKATVPMQGAHLVSLRQLGYELLNSPELRKLIA